MPEGERFEAQIRSQPEALAHLLASSQTREEVHAAAQGLHRARRMWLVGTGSSLHAAELGAAMLQETGRTALAVSSMRFVDWAPSVDPRDAVIVISHTAESAFSLAARATAFAAGMEVLLITRQGAGFPGSIETVERESAQTYSVSYTGTLLVLAMLAQAMGAQSFAPDTLTDVPEAVASAIDGPGLQDVPADARVVVFVGAGAGGVTAREGALKLREGARVLAEGYDAEGFLHGAAVPLGVGDHVVTLTPPDAEGFLTALGAAARAAGCAVTDLHEPWPLPTLLAQIPLTARLQVLTLRLARERKTDPDVVIRGAWEEPALWSHGRPPG
jgi:glucosamine--fructose-6-phosphate aminotransferase (isomerizing)